MLCLWCKQISRFTWFSHSHPTSSLLLSLKYCFQVIQSDVHTYIYQSQQKTMDYGCVECVTNATYCSTLHYHYCPQCRQYSVMTIDSWELVSGDWEIYYPPLPRPTPRSCALRSCSTVSLCPLVPRRTQCMQWRQTQDAIILVKLAITPKYVC